MSTGADEAFIIYHEGVVLQLQWTSVPPLPRQPAIRLCAVERQFIFLLTVDGSLYTARLDAARSVLRLELQRTDVVDVNFCQQTRQLFVVTTRGVVLMQQLAVISSFSASAWQTLSFDPLELSEEGIFVQRVCCSAQGVIFTTRTGAVYVMGSCGDVFTAEAQPKHMRLFEEQKEVLEMAAGDEYFAVLLKRSYDENEDMLDLLGKKAQNRAGTSSSTPSPRLKRIGENDTLNTEQEKKQELNSNSSLRSFSSKSSQSHGEQNFEANVQQLLKQGYALLNTQVHTFGGSNNGLLGTGDHIKRASINNLQKLDAVGVCSIAAGKEHSVARTLDGRLFHWGHNSQQQLSNNAETVDLSAPTELKLDKSEWTEQQRSILEACCGDFQTVLLNARNELHVKDTQLLGFNRDFVTLQMRDAAKQTLPLLLAAADYTLHNHREFQRQYHGCYNNLQTQLRLMLKHRQAIGMLQMFEQKTAAVALKQLQLVCRCFLKILYLLAAALKSLESFYRGDYDNVAELLFINYHRECIELFEQYGKAYCDIYSIDAFAEAGKVCAHFAATTPSEQREDTDFVRVFQQPFQVFPNFVQFLDQLLKTRSEFAEHLRAWQNFATRNRIDLELAEHTQDFWQLNERNLKIRHFRRKHRRVILTSARVALKLSQSGISMTSNTFILFSDCLLQAGSQLHTFPLVVMWLKMDNDTSFRVITPERSFTLIARSNHDKKLWYDQLESSIKTALGRPSDSKLSNVRTTAYIFSKNHAKYAGVHAYGRWRNGVMHGNCYLEYPDGRFYFGEVRNGEIEGYGKMVIPSVGLYEGTFKSGKFHGHGTYEMKDNETYEGNFRDGLFHGHGMLRTNNYTYVGEYQANARCGYGILDDMSMADKYMGDKYMGMFADNKRTGAGTCITMNGDYFEGIFVNDELAGTGIAVFENNYYYEGELTLQGPIGKGTYYMPSSIVEADHASIGDDDEFANRQMLGNILSGQLSGNWQDVRVITGSMSINRQFPKYPNSIGDLVVDNTRKWRSLFDNFEEEILAPTAASSKKPDSSVNATKSLWNRIAIFMTTRRKREKTLEQQDNAYQSTRSYFARNISLGYSSSFDKISLKSTNSLLTTAKSSILDLSSSLTAADPRRSHSQETLYDADLNDFDMLNSYNFAQYHNEENSFSSLHAQLDNWANDTSASLRSSFDSVLNLTGSCNNNNSFSSQNGLEFVPSFGITTLTEQDVAAIKEYLAQAFKDHHHPLFLLNQRIANCFYTSYGCWKVKPTAILAKQAMREWESISKRVYKFVRKMFPALPEDYCIIESTREVVSHITLLYPSVLSEGIYSTLFVLYANKYSRKDEMYRQNLLFVEKLNDDELAACLGLESSLLPVVRNKFFVDAIQTLKQLQEKYSPKAMLTVIENCMQLITDAHKRVESENAVILAADSIMPLTLFLVLRAAVPHLGAELALLDDLTGGSNFQFEMNGIAGYCYTTLKASYEHITAKPLSKA